MRFGKRYRMLGALLAGCTAFTALFPGNIYAQKTEGVDTPYHPFREPQYAYSAQGMSASVGIVQDGYGGERVLDCDSGTLWEGRWDEVEVEDAWIVLDLGGAKNVSGIAQLPRGNFFEGGDLNGVITGYDVLVSTDGGRTYKSKAKGVWDERKEWKYVHFETVAGVTHIKLQATALSQKPQNPKNVTVAELRVLNDQVQKGSADNLTAILETAALLEEQTYTADSWKTLQNAVGEAEALLGQTMYVQEEADRVCERVQEAMDGLREKDAFDQLLEAAKEIDNSDDTYYKNTYYALEKTIREAEYQVQQGASDAERKALTAKLQAAADGLIVRDETENAFDTQAAKDAIGRLIGSENQNRISQIELRGIDKKECDYDYYEYYEKDGRLVIAGTTNASILTGFHHWLKYVAKCDISWKEDQVNLPEQIPMPEKPVYQSANAQRRFSGNDMTEQYDANFWSWEDWEREIDLLALNGFNQVLVYVGQESVFYKTFEKLGVNNMLAEMPRVSFSASLFLGGSWRFKADHEKDSGNIMTSTTPDIMQARLEIGQKVCNRLRELGMEPIMPGCSGYLSYGKIEGISDSDIVWQEDWASMPRPGWLKPTSNFYPRLASAYYKVQKELFGECKNWKIDLFNEGGSSGDVNPAEAGRIIQQEMLKANPDATWHIMHWTGPNPDMLRGTDTSKVFIHDIKTEDESFNREETWSGAEYGFSHLNSMGSRTIMGSRIKDLSAKYWEWMAKPGTKLDGVGVAPEGGHHEPIVLEALGELAWQDAPSDGAQWFLDYADRRYGLVEGQPDEHARRAWEILGDIVYNKTGNNPVGDILFAMTPSHYGTMASPTGPSTLGFDAGKMREALNELLQVNPVLRETRTWQYDVILVTAQVFTAYSREALPQIRAAFENRDLNLYEQLTTQWLEAILALDRITGTNENYMLGTWIEDAVSLASTEEGKQLMEMDAKEINTIWGPRVNAAEWMFLNYANKTWSGYLRDLYYNQWNMFFANNIAVLKGEDQPYPEVATSDGEVSCDNWYEALWFDFGEGTGQFEGIEYPTEPVGDTYKLVREGLEIIGSKSPDNVTNLKGGQAAGSADIILSWDASDNSSIEKYEIYQGAELIAETDEAYYVVTGLSEETEYVFGVKAVNTTGYGSELKTVAVTTGKDEKAPEITTAEFGSATKLSLCFNERVTVESAQDTANYKINYDVQVTGAQLSKDGKTVILTLQGAEEKTADVTGYLLTVNGVTDVSKAANACVNQIVRVQMKDGIVLYHPFDVEGKDGKIADAVSGKNADIIGTVTGCEGKNGKALHFGTADEYIDFGRQEAVLGDQFTAGMWVKLDKITPEASQTLLTHGYSGNVAGGIWWLYSNHGTLNFQLHKGNHKITLGTESAVLRAGQWQYVALTRSGRELKLYVDAKLAASGTIPSDTDADTTGIGYTLKAGAEHRNGQNQYNSMMGLNGSMDEVIVYNRALTREEISSVMTDGISIKKDLFLTASENAEHITKLSWHGAEGESSIENYRVIYLDENMNEVLAKDAGMESELAVSLAAGRYFVKVIAQNARKDTLYESNYLGLSITGEEAKKEKLGALISDVQKKLEQEEYTDSIPVEIKALLQNALQEAVLVHENAYAAQEDVDAAYEALMSKLRLAEEFRQLQEQIAEKESELQEKLKDLHAKEEEAKKTKAEAEKAKASAEQIQKEAKEAAENAKKAAEAARKEAELARAEVKKAKAEAEAAKEEALRASIAKVSLKTAKSSKRKQIKITWSKQKNIDGYELWRSTDSKFKKAVKTTVGKSKTGYTVKKQKSRKKYYVKVRAYKKKDGKKIYGAFSRTLSVKVK